MLLKFIEILKNQSGVFFDFCYRVFNVEDIVMITTSFEPAEMTTELHDMIFEDGYNQEDAVDGVIEIQVLKVNVQLRHTLSNYNGESSIVSFYTVEEDYIESLNDI